MYKLKKGEEFTSEELDCITEHISSLYGAIEKSLISKIKKVDDKKEKIIEILKKEVTDTNYKDYVSLADEILKII